MAPRNAPYPSQRNRVNLTVSPEHRDKLNRAATKNGLTQKAAIEALIELFASSDVEIVKMVKAMVAKR